MNQYKYGSNYNKITTFTIDFQNIVDMTEIALLSKLEEIVSTNADYILKKHFLKTTARFKPDGSIITDADIELQKSLAAALKKLSPDTLMLGEEMNALSQQHIIDSEQSYWCLDPVDGSNNFHHGLPLFAVSLALVQNRQVQLGIIYDPIRKEIFSASKGSGLRINQQYLENRRQPVVLQHCLANVDFKRLSPELKIRLLQIMPFKSQRNIGTCALEWAWLATGRTQLLLHGGEKLWDYAAGSLLVDESGGRSCTLNGEPVFNNSLEARSVIAGSSEELHRLWLTFLSE